MNENSIVEYIRTYIEGIDLYETEDKLWTNEEVKELISAIVVGVKEILEWEENEK